MAIQEGNKMNLKQGYRQKTSIASIYAENTQIIKLLIQPHLIEKMKKIDDSGGANTSIILTELLLQKLDLLKEINSNRKAKRSINQYVLPQSLKDKLKHVAISHRCYAYEVVERCINDLTSEDENEINIKLLARFRNAEIV